MTGFPYPDVAGVRLAARQLARFRSQPLVPVRLPNGREALLVTRYADVRTVLSDPRFSRARYGRHPMLARSSANLALVTSDPPVHTRRRRAAAGAFTARRAEAARPEAERIAERTLDRLVATGPPADLVADFCVPYSFGMVLHLLDLPETELPVLGPWAQVLTSAGRYGPEQVDDAQERIRGYFREQVRRRREAVAAGRPGRDVLTHLLCLPGDPLHEDEIVTLGFGLLMAGGDTTANHLAMCLYQLLDDPGLAAALRADPARVGSMVEELLRWVWVAHTGGQPHVVCEQVQLAGVRLRPGQLVVPLTDAANRDPDAFPAPDEFRADRSPNPHLGFGHGRHLCLGAAHARVELQVALLAVTRRLPSLRLAVPAPEVPWRQDMFIRGPWRLPAR